MLQNDSSEQLISLWDEYDRIQVLVHRLREQQECPILKDRAEKMPDFERWLEIHGAVYSGNVGVNSCYYVC